MKWLKRGAIAGAILGLLAALSVHAQTQFPQQVTTGRSTIGIDQPTVANSSHTSGQCVGGFRSVTVADYYGQSGFVVNFRVASESGVTPTLTIYLFDSNPSASTCTDAGTFTLANADLDKLIVAPTQTAITLAAPTGATQTFGSVDFAPPRVTVAGGKGTSGLKTIYYGIVTGTTFTPAANGLHIRAGVALN